MNPDGIAAGADGRQAALALLAPLMTAAGTERGQFRLVAKSPLIACLPRSLSLDRVSAAVLVARPLPIPDVTDLTWGFRLATAVRQDLWRRMQRVRGLAPAVVVSLDAAQPRVTALACMLDGAPASPLTLDALDEILDDAALRRHRRWAERTRHPGGRRKT